MAISDEDGEWRYELPAGVYSVSAPAELNGYVIITELTVTVNLSPGAHVHLDFGYVAPTRMTVEAVRATRDTGGVRLQWTARTTLALVGFNVYRSTTAGEHGHKLNTAIIPPGGAPGEIHAYSYADALAPADNATYFYWLELIHESSSTWIGPLAPSRLVHTYLPAVFR